MSEASERIAGSPPEARRATKGGPIVVLDAHGTDAHPTPEVRGALEALEQAPGELTLVGDAPRLEAAVRKLRGGKIPAGLSFVHAPNAIAMKDSPSRALRRKKDTSMVRAFELVAAGEADAVVTAGSSGAAMMLGTFMLGRLDGVIRPAILNHFPTLPGGTAVMLDGGANVDCRPEWLVQFATMGATYARTVLKMGEPRVGLLANGTEEGKGNELVRATHERLRAAKLPGYLGLVEPHDAFRGNCDVLVVDGFTGNLILKATEGTVEMILSLLRREITRRPFARLGAFLVRPAFKAVRRRTSYDEYGAAVLLGVKKPTFIAHGRSNAKAIKNAILFARRMVEAAPAEAIAAALRRS